MIDIADVNKKSITCKGCPDRSIEPNCHTDCEGYKTRVKRIRMAHELKRHEHRALDTTYGFELMRRRYGK